MGRSREGLTRLGATGIKRTAIASTGTAEGRMEWCDSKLAAEILRKGGEQSQKPSERAAG